ncbi:spermidine/putrescine transport system substrate-binding protein [Hamadaea flava]|uniref:PotD/PotF family extracellular solute-binding protein n=1 Tax=Hamadaea flava TaxID=1742688 RepID=A0ABV8LHF4_9ACTN|nr:spermidine/putrescine ABC transporter substrate-binding protein [Hamadaea flava]MCP2326684.1 spermidine/putrescine transport system substrate-binding protein [Hamadaea flava]
MRSSSRKPLSPEAKALLDVMPTRRGLLRGVAAGGALALTGGALAACGTKAKNPTSSASSAAPACTVTDVSAQERKLVFSNWVEYLDLDEKTGKHPTLDAFKAKTGIDVTYREDINDNDEFYGKIRAQLADCKPIEPDLIVFTDWLSARMIKAKQVAKFEPTKVATFQKNLLPSLKGRSYDPDNVYAAPWQSGFTGIGYNTKVVKTPVKSVEELLTRSDLKGKVAVMTELNDTMGLILLSLGKDPANFTSADYDAALEKLKKAVDSGHIRRVAGNDYLQDLAKGDIAACIGWSGDVLATEGNVEYVIPEEGQLYWSDNMLIPISSTHASNAMSLIDYYYDPKVAAEVAAWVSYICPVAGAQEAMKAVDAELVEDNFIFPTDAELAKAHPFMTVDDDVRKDYERKFRAVIGA